MILELLKVIRETENDDLTGTMQRLVCTYVEDVIPIAVEMMSHLVSMIRFFDQIKCSKCFKSEKRRYCPDEKQKLSCSGGLA